MQAVLVRYILEIYTGTVVLEFTILAVTCRGAHESAVI
jgi:hypothetical protein